MAESAYKLRTPKRRLVGRENTRHDRDRMWAYGGGQEGVGLCTAGRPALFCLTPVLGRLNTVSTRKRQLHPRCRGVEPRGVGSKATRRRCKPRSVDV